MIRKETKESIFHKLKRERDYQDHLCTIKNMPLQPTIEGEILMLKTYIDKISIKFTTNSGDEALCGEMRKIAAIAIRALENHGCPNRKFLESMSNNEN